MLPLLLLLFLPLPFACYSFSRTRFYGMPRAPKRVNSRTRKHSVTNITLPLIVVVVAVVVAVVVVFVRERRVGPPFQPLS